MSYDLALYVGRAFALTPPDAGDGRTFFADPPARVEEADIPAEYLPLLGKRRRWLVWLSIEGAPSPDRLAAFDSWLAGMLIETDGVLIDEQAGRFQTSGSGGDLPSSAPKAPVQTAEMSFYFVDANAFLADGLARVLDAVARILPEALPARYGPYEPLQGKVVNGDLKPLLAAFAQDPRHFLKAKSPFGHIDLNLPCDKIFETWHPDHFLRREFLAGRLAFELKPKALDDPRLAALFREISADIPVFYAEIRDHECPVDAWFWRGLPTGPVRAFCLGAPYLALWPEAAARGVPVGNGVIFVAPTRLDPTLPDPPADIRDPEPCTAPRDTIPAKYARTFPFDVPNRGQTGETSPT